MKKVLLGIAVLMAFVSAIPARAAEVYGGAIPPDFFTAPPAFAPPRAYNWTGVYIGIDGGGGWGRSHWVSTPDGAAANYSLSGGLVGGTLGYNLQAGTSSFVLGGEVDLAWTNIKGTTPPVVAPITTFDPVTGAAIVTPTPISCVPNCEITNPWLATARLRFGYSFDWILPYLTAGVAIGRLETNIAGIPMGRQSKNNLSWTVGGGVEVAISGPWTAKLEYLHAELSGISCDMACGASTVSINMNENIIRAGLNYRIWNR
jgi:outer membrane immunogenic protein